MAKGPVLCPPQVGGGSPVLQSQEEGTAPPRTTQLSMTATSPGIAGIALSQLQTGLCQLHEKK